MNFIFVQIKNVNVDFFIHKIHAYYPIFFYSLKKRRLFISYLLSGFIIIITSFFLLISILLVKISMKKIFFS